MKSVWNIAKDLDLTAATMWGDSYEYDPRKKYEHRGSEKVWTWWPKNDTFSGMHFTIWENDSDAKDLLRRFHITFNYDYQSHKPVHIYYNIRGAKPNFSNVDANRAGSDSAAAKAYTDTYASQFDDLAWKFVKAAVWE